MISRNTITTTTLAIAGFGLWAYAGGQLKQDGRFEYNPNPLGLKMSPYGQVIAMAIQTPIDADWHGGIESHGAPDTEAHEDHSDCGHEGCETDHHAAHEDCDHGDCEGHHHEPAVEIAEKKHSCSDPDCGHDHGGAEQENPSLLSRLSRVASKRTNPNPPTEGHRFYLRREIEKKLRFAYQLDPSHYANYNSYHLFLTQTSLSTSDVSYSEARKFANALSEQTIRYCLREQHDPRPALTAVSAAYNILEGMFLAPREQYTNEELRAQLGVIDFCLNRHLELLEASTRDETWNLLSEHRQAEALERTKFSVKLREAAEKAILHRERPASITVSHDPS